METYSAHQDTKEEEIDNLNLPRCLIVDDDMSVYNIASNLDFAVQPCTHFELMSTAGQQYFSAVT